MDRSYRVAAACLVTALLAACQNSGPRDAEEAALSNRLDSGEILREEQARAEGRILPPFGSNRATAKPAEGTAQAADTAGSMAAPAPAAGDQGALPLGEYGCIGSGTTQLAGMGSKLLPGGKYTDLEGGSPGTYRIVGTNIVFSGGHLDGETGRDIKNNGYTIGKMVSCQKW